MESFKCVDRKIKRGINWCDQSRTYILCPTWLSMISSAKIEVEVKNIGDFYFPRGKNELPEHFDQSPGGFKGKAIFEWLEENATDKVKVFCRREYALGDFGDIDTQIMKLYFASEIDLLGFRLWWE